MKKGLFLDQSCPPFEVGVAPADSDFGVLPYFCAHGLTYRVTKFGVLTHKGKGRVSGGQPCHCIFHKCVARFVSDS